MDAPLKKGKFVYMDLETRLDTETRGVQTSAMDVWIPRDHLKGKFDFVKIAGKNYLLTELKSI